MGFCVPAYGSCVSSVDIYFDIFCRNMYNYDTGGTKTGCMHRSLPGTVPDSNFSLGVVEVMYDCSTMKSNETSAVIATKKLTLYCIFITVILEKCTI